MGIVIFYAVLGGMKGITYPQVAQYCVLIFAFLVPAIFISFMLTDNFIPQISFGEILPKLDQIHTELGFKEYTSGTEGFPKRDSLRMFKGCLLADSGRVYSVRIPQTNPLRISKVTPLRIPEGIPIGIPTGCPLTARQGDSLRIPKEDPLRVPKAIPKGTSLRIPRGNPEDPLKGIPQGSPMGNS